MKGEKNPVYSGPPGYGSRAYAESLRDFGEPYSLPRSGGHILIRRVPGRDLEDAMGCYPLFCCSDWLRLGEDLEALSGRIVALSLVADPFGEYNEELLRNCFPDRVFAFKQHYVVDLAKPVETYVSKHHLRNVRKGERTHIVEVCDPPSKCLEEWIGFYGILIERHGIRGMAAFSGRSFEAQFQVPGLVAIRACAAGQAAGILLWFVQGDTAYYHLGAYSPEGYGQYTSFALFHYSIQHFASRKLKWLCLGAGAGTKANPNDGLTRFKQGWATGTRTAYFCGRVFDQEAYHRLTEASGASSTEYFPAYRVGEFRQASS